MVNCALKNFEANNFFVLIGMRIKFDIEKTSGEGNISEKVYIGGHPTVHLHYSLKPIWFRNPLFFLLLCLD